MTAAAIVKRWRSELQSRGFVVKRGGAVRSIGSLSHGLWIQGSRLYPGQFRFNLEVGIWDPFLTTPDFTSAVRAHLEEDGVRFAEREAWWSSDKSQEIFDAFVRFGPPWFASVADRAHTLLSWFDSALRLQKPLQYLFEPLEGLPQDDLCTLLSQFGNTMTAPPIYWKHASLLAYFERDYSKACESAQRWLTHLQTVKEAVGSEEPRRTLSQIQQMRC